MNKIKRRAYYGQRTFSSSIPIGTSSGMDSRLCLTVDSKSKWEVMKMKINGNGMVTETVQETLQHDKS